MAVASPVQSLQEEVTCCICLEYYKDPVTTDCGHNFCRTCINQFWKEDVRASCPQCREICSQTQLRPNRQLLSTVELVKQISLQSPTPNLCEEHDEKLKLFCKEDEKAVCLVCTMSTEHGSHTTIPIKEAALEYKSKLQNWLLPLKDEKKEIVEFKQKEEKDSKDLRNILFTEKEKTLADFEKLHKLLKESEKTILGKLEDMDKKIQNAENAKISKLSQQISSLNSLITEIEEKYKQPAEKLLKDVRRTLNRCENVRFLTPEEKIKKYKVLVTLDPKTMSDWVILSENGRRVKSAPPDQKLPYDAKRFTGLTPCVLGSEGFSSGKHYWEVRLLVELDGWSVGLAQDSVDRTQTNVAQSPKKGIWAVRGYKGVYWSLTTPRARLSLCECPRKLGLFLDYEGDQLSVYNADTLEHIYTFFHAQFKEKVYPFFCLSKGQFLTLNDTEMLMV